MKEDGAFVLLLLLTMNCCAVVWCGVSHTELWFHSQLEELVEDIFGT